VEFSARLLFRFGSRKERSPRTIPLPKEDEPERFPPCPSEDAQPPRWPSAANAPAQGVKREPPTLFPVRQNNKWGYIDRTGKLAIPAQYDAAWDFSEGLAYVKSGASRGVIDKTGRMLFQLQQVDIAGYFTEGLAPVQTASQPPRFGFIDKMGRIVINTEYDAVRDFSEGLALVMVGRLYGFIDKRGRTVVKPQFEKASSFSEGLALVVVDNKLGFIDKTGRIVIKPQYNNAYNFSEGLANVAVGGSYGCIDKRGAFVIPVQAGYVGSFSEGLAPIIVANKFGYIDRAGAQLVKPQFDWATGFSEGLARVKVGGKSGAKYGFIDRTGQLVVPAQFDNAQDFAGGLARVYVGGKQGYIDKSGRYVWQPTK
jgi:hypothetical protein